jgi:hypothetical protein
LKVIFNDDFESTGGLKRRSCGSELRRRKASPEVEEELQALEKKRNLVSCEYAPAYEEFREIFEGERRER